MNIDVDVIIVAVFLLTTLAVGISKGRHINNIREFAVGNRDFTTTALVCTIVATWIGGEDFFILISESYTDGLYFILSYSFGILAVILLIGLFFTPRMAEFLGSLSIAEVMGKLYGNQAKLVSAIAGCIGTAGVIAAQLKIAGLLFEYALDVSSIYGIVIGASIVTIYSAFGGIKSVTFTDVIQFFMFGAILPTLALFIFGTLGSTNNLIITLASNENFNYKQIFDFSSSKSLYYLFIFLWVAVPSFDPAIFQRISMAKDVFQAIKSFIIAAFVFFALTLTMSWIGVIALSIYPDVAPDAIAKHIIMDYSYTGLKGLTLAGILAMLMSTADSYINSTSVLFTHDFCNAAGIKIKNELITSRIVALILGIFATILALYSTNLLQLIITTKSFYMPIVSIPFMFSIFGFRSSSKSVLIGMGAGFITVVLWEIFLRGHTVDSVIPGMAANIIFLFASHYLLGESGGWVGIKDYSPVIKLRQERKERLNQFVCAVKNFNFMKFCEKNSPKQDSVYLNFGIFCMFSTYFSIYTMPQSAKINYQELINFIYPSVFFVATALISYPIWIESLKKTRVISVIWVAAVFYILVCVGSIQVLIGNFSKFQLMTFILNFVVLAILTRWPVAMFMMIAGLLSSVQFFKWYSGIEVLVGNLNNLQFTIAYLLLFMSAILVAFLKPKQEYLETTEAKVVYLEKEADFARRELENVVQGLDFLENQFKDKEGKLKAKEIYLKDQLKLRNIEIAKLKDLKDEFIRNIPHEANTPLTGILSLSDVLYSCYDSLDRKTLKQSIKDIVNSSDRLKTYINNIADLSKLSALTYELNKEEVDLSEIVRERPVLYKKIFTDDAKQKFIFKVEDKLMVQCDEYYITQAIDNLVSNAVKYGEGKPITISLTKTVNNKVKFTIMDQGIGIPKDELISIFHKFTTSSKTRTPAGGRGIGLALCEKVITVHGGNIEAQSDGKKGASFSFVLPC